MLSDHEEALVDAERIKSVFQQAPLTLVITAINAVLTAIVLAPVGDQTALLIWVVAVFIVAATRWVVRWRALRDATNNGPQRSWAFLSILGSLMMGILWGLGAAVLSPAAEPYQLFFAFVIGGMCAGATAVNSAHLPTVLAFILPASLPLAARFLAEGTRLRVVSALMIVVFVSALSLVNLRAHRAFGDRLRLQFALRRQSEELSQANERLRKEVAEREKAEASLHQAQKMEAIGHLTGGIAHDFNNLLHVVSGNLGIIDRLVEGNMPLHGYVQAAENAVQQGARLTGSLLAFGRRQTLKVEQVNANKLLREFEPILIQAVGDAIELRTFFASDLPSCEVDPTHFQAAILNLVLNARDAMPGAGELSITTGVTSLRSEDLLANPDASPGRFVSISVQDNGCGIQADLLGRVFEPFFTTKEIGKGSGLGLSQVFGFVRQSRGHVDIDSKPEAGTRVTLYLPAGVE